MDDIVRITPLFAVLISIGFVSFGGLVGGITSFFAGRKWESRKSPETAEKLNTLKEKSGRKSLRISALMVFVKAVELALASLHDQLGRLK